jgi:elongation factor P
MNVETYEQISLTKDVVGEKAKYLKENINLYLCEYDGKVINIKLPITVEQEIRETEPGFRGDTAQSTTKPAVTETGLSVYVPLFVEVGDIIRIDTRTGKYIERVKR